MTTAKCNLATSHDSTHSTDSKLARVSSSPEIIEMMVRAQALSADILSNAPIGEVSHDRYLASVQEFAFVETE